MKEFNMLVGDVRMRINGLCKPGHQHLISQIGVTHIESGYTKWTEHWMNQSKGQHWDDYNIPQNLLYRDPKRYMMVL